MRVTIDIGTNTALLLVSEWEHGALRVHRSERRYVRLGEGLGAAGRVSEAALGRFEAVITEYREIASGFGAIPVLIAGTSASRDASNRNELVRLVEQLTGWDYRILSGKAEARLTFLGATAPFEREASDRQAVVDIGGGSTELVSGTSTSIDGAISVDMGTVRLAERFFGSQPAGDREIHAASQWIRHQLISSATTVGSHQTLIGAAGTATVLGRLHAGIDADLLRVQLTRAEVCDWMKRLLSMTYDDVLGLAPALLAGRADVFPGGVLLLAECMDAVGAEVLRVSPWGLRHGMAIAWFSGGTIE